MESRIVEFLLRFRLLLAILSVVLAFGLAAGAKNLYFDGDFNSFFDKDDAQRVAYEGLQETYTKSDSLAILIKPATGDIFTPANLALVKELTDDAWLAPYAIRVDSLSNYQYSRADGDELIVEDFIDDPLSLDEAGLAELKRIALSEKQLLHRAISKDAKTTLIFISLELPEVPKGGRGEEQDAQRFARNASFMEVVAYGNELSAKAKSQHPNMEVHLLGPTVITASFNSIGQQDGVTLTPLMYLIILLALGWFFRSAPAVFACLIIIALATSAAMGMAGWLGLSLNMITILAPVIILTIAVCDSVHLVVIYLRQLELGQSRLEAMRESLTVNLQPIILTSLTTSVGFLTLNFSVAPNFRVLGNISAFGVVFAMLVSLTLMPALVISLVRKSRLGDEKKGFVYKVSDFVVARKQGVFWGSIAVAVLMIALIPLNVVDDDPIKYFKDGVPYRDAAVFSQDNMPGIKNIGFSVDCGEPDCVNEPEFLKMLEEFDQWLMEQEGVEYVMNYVDVIKRLNRNMHGDDPAWYKLTDSRELAAQYQLLYELSLPYGLDLNNQLNFDKSATRVEVWMRQVTTSDFLAIQARAGAWLKEHNNSGAAAHGSSVHMMFASMGERNIASMIIGAIAALVGVTITIIIAMGSFKYGLLSMIPNAFPAAMAFGLWGLLVGQVNMAVASVFSITLGIVVDNTVHFISKYRRAKDRGSDTEASVRYAFTTVGKALLITTGVLAIGFAVLTLSRFNVNAHMGGLTAITVVVALIFDFLMLPALLLLIDKGRVANTEFEAATEEKSLSSS